MWPTVTNEQPWGHPVIFLGHRLNHVREFPTTRCRQRAGNAEQETRAGPVYRFFGLPGDLNVESRPSFLAVSITQSGLP